MNYPFEKVRPDAKQQQAFQKSWPQVSAALGEFFRVTAVASVSVQQKDIFGNPQGIRRDLGVEDSLKMLILAGFNDGIFTAQTQRTEIMDLLRQLSLTWYTFGLGLKSCVYLGYYFYEQHATALHAVENLRDQIEFLASVRGQGAAADAGAAALGCSHSKRWYRAREGIGDKRHGIFIAYGDFTKTDLPRPGYQIHFKKTKLYDLRAPFFVEGKDVEQPLIQHDKITASCPQCGQKCRGKLFAFIEIKCPTCSTVWQQKT